MNKVPGIWKWMVGILFVLNLTLLATIWFKPGGRQEGPRMGEGERPNEFIEKSLHFSQDQVKAFDVLRGRHHDSILMLQKQGQDLRKEYFDNLKHPETADTNRVNAIAVSIADNQKEVELVTYRHFRQVRALCDEKQKPIFDNIIDDVLRMMSGPHHGKGERGERERRAEGDGPPHEGGPEGNGPPPQR